MDTREFKVGEKLVFIPKWNMKKQIQNQPTIFPLVSDAVASAIMMATENGEEDGDVGMFSAALVKSVMTGIGGANMEQVFNAVLEGVGYTQANGVKDILTLDKAEAAGFTLADIYAISIEVIMENYGPLLKDGFQILFGAMNNRPQQNEGS